MTGEACAKSAEDSRRTDEIKLWVDDLRASSKFSRKRIPFSAMRQWAFDENGILRHESGKFFSIEGRRITDRLLNETRYQPIINQNEHGILGILTQEQDGVQKFMLQAKIEPGNINTVQLSPTVQATESNYKKAHKGRSVTFIEYFRDEMPDTTIVFSELQSEHGWKFLGKSNRNMLVEIAPGAPVKLPTNFAWLTLGEIAELLQHEHYINMDSRSVLSCLPPAKPADASDTEAWIRAAKRTPRYVSEPCSMDELYMNGWERTDTVIRSDTDPDFVLVMLDVAVDREIASWVQPIVEDLRPKLHGMVAASFDDGWKILAQACEEGFSADGAEIGPTVHNDDAANPVRPFSDYFTGKKGRPLYDRMQSEEGGRFLTFANRYAITAADAPFEAPAGYRWVSVAEVKKLMNNPCFVNIEARTLIACMPHTII